MKAEGSDQDQDQDQSLCSGAIWICLAFQALHLPMGIGFWGGNKA